MSHRHHRSADRPRQHALRLTYQVADALTEVFLYCEVIFTPWAFGTTQPWSIRVMNGLGYLLGALLLTKGLIRWLGRYQPARWDRQLWNGQSPSSQTRFVHPGLVRHLTWVMGGLTVLILAYCLTSALNARATYLPASHSLSYHECISWLPHSYDRISTWNAFWMYLGWALTFWAARDWLLGLTTREESEDRGQRTEDGGQRTEVRDQRSEDRGNHGARYALPDRLRRLLWVICINGSLLAAEGIIQRLIGTNKLLGLVIPRINRQAIAQFGPYAYRTNAAQYLNLIWPMSVALVWIQARAAKRARQEGLRPATHSVAWLGLGSILMAVAPFVSSSRGGAIIALALLVFMMILLSVADRKHHWREQLGWLLSTFIIIQLVIILGWDNLMLRFETLLVDNLSGRPPIYENAHRMAQDFPWLGAGPDSFAALYQFYRVSYKQEWAAYAHNDWLEFLITHGRIGFSLMILLLISVPLKWLANSRPVTHWLLPAAMLAGMGGCLLHARYDFPFQVPSIVLLFIIICAALSAIGRSR